MKPFKPIKKDYKITTKRLYAWAGLAGAAAQFIEAIIKFFEKLLG